MDIHSRRLTFKNFCICALAFSCACRSVFKKKNLKFVGKSKDFKLELTCRSLRCSSYGRSALLSLFHISNLDVESYMHLVKGSHYHPATRDARWPTPLRSARAAVSVLCSWRRIDILVHMHQNHELQRFLLIRDLKQAAIY